MVEATLLMLRAARPHLQPDDYVILLSGDSYPLQDCANIERFFAAGSGAQYINTVPMPAPELHKPITRISKFHLEYDPRAGKSRKNFIHRVVDRLGVTRDFERAFNGRPPHAGSTWWALTGGAVMWIMDEISEDPRFVRFCRWTKHPDEFFFQTVLASSPYAGDVRCGPMFTEIAPPHRIDADHIRRLKEHAFVTHSGYGTSVALFARKVTDPQTTALIRAEAWTCEVSQPAR